MRKSNNRLIGGVCSGISEDLKINAILVRVLFIVTSYLLGRLLLKYLLSFVSLEYALFLIFIPYLLPIILYIIIWFVLPKTEGNQNEIQAKKNKKALFQIIGIIIGMILGFLIAWEYSESLSYNKGNFLGTVF